MILETRHLELVVAVADHGTLTRAAAEVNLTQSAVSHKLLTLEARLGVKLFNRTSRRLTPTAMGMRVLETARRTLSELRSVEREVVQHGAAKATIVRVSTECYATYHWLPRVVAPLAARIAPINVEIVAGATPDPMLALRDGRIDVAIMMERVVGKRVSSFALFEDEMVTVVARSHRLAGSSTVDLEALADEHLLVYSSLDRASSFLGKLLRDRGITPRKISEIQITEAMLELVAAGVGLCVLARWAIPDQYLDRGLEVIPLSPNIRRRWHAVTLRKGGNSVAIREFVSLVKGRVGALLEAPGSPDRTALKL